MSVKKNFNVKVLQKGVHYMTLDYGNTYRDGSFHKGIDLIGNPDVDGGYDYIVAMEEGKVTSTKNTVNGVIKDTGTPGMGNYVIIDHGNGYKTRYMHMKKGSVTVKAGDKVKKGQVIGYMGNTGNSTGRHLHFDISQNGVYIDPKPFLNGTKSIKSSNEKKKIGTYQVTGAVNVRTYSGVSYPKVKYENFTKEHQDAVYKITKKKVNEFPKGMKVEITEISGTWGKTASGWISINYCKKV